MDRNQVLVIFVVVLALLGAGVMYAMFTFAPVADFEKSRLYFAAGVLAFLAFIFILSMLIYAFGTDPSSGSAETPGKVIFDACVKVIPPIVTLIIGFYFASYQATKSADDANAKSRVQTTTQPPTSKP